MPPIPPSPPSPLIHQPTLPRASALRASRSSESPPPISPSTPPVPHPAPTFLTTKLRLYAVRSAIMGWVELGSRLLILTQPESRLFSRASALGFRAPLGGSLGPGPLACHCFVLGPPLPLGLAQHFFVRPALGSLRSAGAQTARSTPARHTRTAQGRPRSS